MFIEVNGIRLNTVSFGTGKRVFLGHGGFVGNWELWQQPFELMSKHWRCVSYDHRGAGESPVPPEKISKTALVDDIFAVMDQFQIKRCVLGGESQGGVIALMAVMRQPDRFEGLVLVDASNPNPGPLTDMQKQFITGLRTNYPTTIKAFVDDCIPEPNSEHFRRWALNICLRVEPAVAARLAEINEDNFNLTPSDIPIPTLIIHGSKDIICPLEHSEYLASIIPNSELVVIEGAGHVPIITRPHEVVNAIERHFPLSV